MAASLFRKFALLLAFGSVLIGAQEESAPTEAVAEASTTPKPSRKELKREERERKEEEAKEKAISTAAASKKAQSAAEEALAKLTSYVQQIEAQSNDPSQVEVTVKEVSLKAESQVHQERAALEADYKKAVAALEEAVALGNKTHVLKKLAKKAEDFSDDIFKLGKEKAKLERKAFSKELKQAKKEVDKLGHAVEKAAHSGLKAAHQAESAARKAHEEENVYENTYNKAEETMQAVEDGAERLADLGEDVLEEFYGRVEHGVEKQADAAKDYAASKADERKEEIKTILKQAATKEEAAEAPTGEAPTGEPAQSSLFLGKREGLPHPFAGGAVFILIAFMAMVLLIAKLQTGSREVGLNQHPILG